MGARVIDGRSPAAELKEGLAAEVEELRDAGVVPGLSTVLVGSPAEAEAYEKRVRSLETADAGGVVGIGTMPVRSAGEERIIR